MESPQYDLPLSPKEQERLLRELHTLRLQLERNNRKIQNLEKASRFLVTMNENAERVRDLNEQEILRNKQRAEEASQAKSNFLASMSHEMRTPMNAIKVLSELLLRTDLDKIQKDYARNIVAASGSLLGIINDILDFSKLDARMFEVVCAPYDVTSLLDDVTNIVNLRALDKNIAFFTDIDCRIPSMLEGDDLRLKQILLNVLQNAVKYTAEGSVKLVIRLAESEREDHIELHVDVVDTGIGIREESMDNLFEPFSQADLVNNRQIEGTGLGLSITKGLLELMDGSIEVRSTYGQGSCFSMRIPQKVIDPAPIARVEHPGKLRMLVATDSAHAQPCAAMVRSLGVPCATATDAAELGMELHSDSFTHILYDYDLYQPLLGEMDLGNCKLIAVKDIRYAGRQQTRASTSVLFQPILIHELARVIEFADNVRGVGLHPEASEIGRFAVRDVHALVVDDNEVNLMVMGQLLAQYNMKCTMAHSGIEALEFTGNTRFDLIFMDHMMPIMNGVEATRKIRQSPGPNARTPVIIVTANAIVGMREEFLREGLDDYISKPIDVRELNAILLRWLSPEKIVGENPLAAPDSDGAYAFFMQGMAGLGLNSQEICDNMGYSPQTYLAITDTFLASLPGTLDKLMTGFRDGDFDALRIQVHGVKSALANIGARRLSKYAATLEKLAADQDAEAFRTSFPTFHDELAALVGNIRALRPQLPAADRPTRCEDLPVDQVLHALGGVVDSLDNLDSIVALESLDALLGRLGDGQDELAAKLEVIRHDVENFDYETATDRIRDVMAAYANPA